MATGMLLFLLVFVALLAIPITLTFHVSWRQALSSEVKLKWAFGLVRISLPTIQPQESTEVEDLTHLNQQKEKQIKSRANMLKAFRQKPFRNRIIKFVRDIWNAIKKREMKFYLRIGLNDPADTGQLWAVVGPLSGMLSNLKDATVEIEPEFIDQAFEFDTSGSIQIIPLQLLYLTLAFILSPAFWNGIREARAV